MIPDLKLDRSYKSIEHHIDPVDYASFDEWANNARSISDREWYTGGDWHARSEFWMQGYVILAEDYTPWNVFKNGVHFVELASFDIEPKGEIMQLAKKMNALFSEHPYGDDGRGCPKWVGDEAEKMCWDFLIEFRKTKHYRPLPEYKGDKYGNVYREAV